MARRRTIASGGPGRTDRTWCVECGEDKARVRMHVLRQLKTQKKEDRRRKSEAIWRKLARLAVFRHATTVMCYVSLPYEVDTRPLIRRMLEAGKRVVVPRVSKRQLKLLELRDPDRELAPGAFGVGEPTARTCRPVARKELEMVLVPGLAFDRRGHRLGHGQGYFDRFLSRLPATVPTVGVCFAFQLCDRLPTSPHDHPVQTVLAA